MAVLITILALLVISTVGVVLARVATTEIQLAGNYRGSHQAFYAADGGAEHGLNELLEMGRSQGRFPTAGELATIAGPVLASATFPNFQVSASGPQVTGPLTTGFYQGLVAATQAFTVVATAETTTIPIGRSEVTMTADFDIIPGDVRIRDSSGNFLAMAGLDSTDPDWATEALDRWDGNVRSGEHDVERLNLTIEDPLTPRRIIEPGQPGDTPGDQAAKMWYDAERLHDPRYRVGTNMISFSSSVPLANMHS